MNLLNITNYVSSSVNTYFTCILQELQAQAAAERLARSLKIKMEPYNPEGRNMSYPHQFSNNLYIATCFILPVHVCHSPNTNHSVNI